MKDLLSNNLAMTDLKPENTLFNTETRKATIIDHGGIVKINYKQRVSSYQ